MLAKNNKEHAVTAATSAGDNSAHQFLEEISKAIVNRIALVVAGTVKPGVPPKLAPITEGFMWLRLLLTQLSRLMGSDDPAKVDVAAAVALCPPGVSALITCRVDARVRVSGSDDLKVSILGSNDSEFRFTELAEPYDVTHALHLVCDPANDTATPL